MLMQRSRAGDRDRAATLLAAALDDSRRLGMGGLEERVVELQQTSSGNGRHAARPAGLSEREVQVLRLVADALCRSASTIAIHVRNILDKTQASNRAEAAAFAVRHGLLRD